MKIGVRVEDTEKQQCDAESGDVGWANISQITVLNLQRLYR